MKKKPIIKTKKKKFAYTVDEIYVYMLKFEYDHFPYPLVVDKQDTKDQLPDKDVELYRILDELHRIDYQI